MGMINPMEEVSTTGIGPFKIADSVKEKTKKCQKGFKCLSGDISCFCEVDVSAGKLATVKIKPNDLACPYRLSLNTFHYCLCPIRNEIHKQYKI